jgi:hypothetical protein
MPGIGSRPNIVLQERDLHLLRELATMRVIDREQAKLVAGFGSTTRVNLRLLKLTRQSLLRRFFLGTVAGGKRALYALSQKGARVADLPHRGISRRDAEEVLVADFWVQHQLRVNDLYCRLKYQAIPPAGVSFARWIAFTEPIAQGLSLIPDGYLELANPSGTVASFLEVDLGTEPLRIWREKVESYLQFASRREHERLLGQDQFGVAIVAHSEKRAESIRQTVAKQIDRIFWFTDFQAIHRDDFFGRVWLRPTGDGRQFFLETP